MYFRLPMARRHDFRLPFGSGNGSCGADVTFAAASATAAAALQYHRPFLQYNRPVLIILIS